MLSDLPLYPASSPDWLCHHLFEGLISVNSCWIDNCLKWEENKDEQNEITWDYLGNRMFYSETCLCAVFRNWCQGPIIHKASHRGGTYICAMFFLDSPITIKILLPSSCNILLLTIQNQPVVQEKTIEDRDTSPPHSSNFIQDWISKLCCCFVFFFFAQ